MCTAGSVLSGHCGPYYIGREPEQEERWSITLSKIPVLTLRLKGWVCPIGISESPELPGLRDACPLGNAAELVTLEWSQLAYWRAGDECYIPEGPKSGIGIGFRKAQSQGYPKSSL